MRGPSVCRGAEWDAEGVGNAGSAGRFCVKVFDFGMESSVCEAVGVDVPFEAELSRCAITWDRRMEVAIVRLERFAVRLRGIGVTLRGMVRRSIS